MARVRKANLWRATVAAVTITLVGALGAVPAQAATTADPLQTLADQAVQTDVSGQTVNVAIPVVAASKSGATCRFELNLEASYQHRKWQTSTLEQGYTKTAGSCQGLLASHADIDISDMGIVLISQTHEVFNSDSGGAVYTYLQAGAMQNVPLFQLFGTDYHMFGSTIQWTFHWTFDYAPGWTGPTNECVYAFATWGQPGIETVPCATGAV